MKDDLLTKLLCLLLLFSFGCATSTEMKPRPADFRVQYHWSEGSLPPPYHSEYTIRLGPGLHGEIEFQPDYPSGETPIWIETFEIEDKDLEKLYALMWAKGVFAENWRQSDEVPVGGSADSLQVTADGQQVTVPSYVTGASEAEAMTEVYTAINALVPQPIWTKLNLQYEQYKQDFLTKEAAASPAASATPTSLPPTPTPSATSTRGGANELIVTADSEGIIFSTENAPTTRLADQDEDYWTPSQAEVLELEKQLGPYLQQAAPQDYPGPLRDLSEYKRQYIGVVVNGQQVIFVNFFCDAYDIDWQREFVFISDGGSCYFEVKYDVQTGEFSDLSIHGEA